MKKRNKKITTVNKILVHNADSILNFSNSLRSNTDKFKRIKSSMEPQNSYSMSEGYFEPIQLIEKETKWSK